MQWWDVARAQGGAISVLQLRLSGQTRNAVDRLVQRGELVRFCQGVYITGAAPATTLTRMWAAILATDGVLSHTSAGKLWGVTDAEQGRIHVTLPHSRRVARPTDVVLHRVPVPAYAHATRDRLPVTTRAWTVLDLLAVLPSGEAMTLADRAIQRNWLTPAQLDRRLREQPCRTGNKQLRVIGAQLSDGAAAHSERVLHGLLRRAGISGWRANHPVWVNGELVAVVDVALPSHMVAIEVDGMAFHIDPERFQRDRTRQNGLTACGWTVIRFTWADLVERPGYVIATLRRFGSGLRPGAA